MALNFQDQGTVDLGRSRLQTPDPYQPIRQFGNEGSSMEDIAKSLEKFTGGLNKADARAEELEKINIHSHIQNMANALNGRVPTDEDVNNIGSELHYANRALAAEGVGYLNGTSAAQNAFLKHPDTMPPEQAKSVYDNMLKQAFEDSRGNLSYQAGYLKAFHEAVLMKTKKDGEDRIAGQQTKERESWDAQTDGGLRLRYNGAIPNPVSPGVGGKYAPNNPAFQNLHPQFRDRLSNFLNDLNESGLPVRVTSTFRSFEQQAGMYANRDKNPYPVAPAGHSGHNYGLATDFQPTRSFSKDEWQKVKTIAEANGLKWGGDFGDPIHVQLGNKSFSALKMAPRDDNGHVVLPEDWASPVNNTARKQYASTGTFATDATVDSSSSTSSTSSTLPPSTGTQVASSTPVVAPSGATAPYTSAMVPGQGQAPAGYSTGKFNIEEWQNSLTPFQLGAYEDFKRLDDVFKRTGILANKERRDRYAERLRLFAIEKNDASVLDSIPPSLMTNEIAKNFELTRKHIEDETHTRATRAETAATHREKKAKEDAESAIIQNWSADGEKKVLNPTEAATFKYTDAYGNERIVRDDKLYDLAVKYNTNRGTYVDPNMSRNNLFNYQEAFQSIAMGADPKEVFKDNPAVLRMVGDKTSLTEKDIRQIVLNDPTLTNEDRSHLQANAGTYLNTYKILNDERVNHTKQAGVVSSTKEEIRLMTLDQRFAMFDPKVANAITSMPREVEKTFDTAYRLEYTAWTKANPGQPVPDSLKEQWTEKAEAKAREKAKLQRESIDRLVKGETERVKNGGTATDPSNMVRNDLVGKQMTGVRSDTGETVSGKVAFQRGNTAFIEMPDGNYVEVKSGQSVEGMTGQEQRFRSADSAPPPKTTPPLYNINNGPASPPFDPDAMAKALGLDKASEMGPAANQFMSDMSRLMYVVGGAPNTVQMEAYKSLKQDSEYKKHFETWQNSSGADKTKAAGAMLDYERQFIQDYADQWAEKQKKPTQTLYEPTKAQLKNKK